MADFPVSQRFDKHLFKQHTDNGRSLISRILNKQIGGKQGEKSRMLQLRGAVKINRGIQSELKCTALR